MWRKVKTYLGTGLFLVLPAFITGYLLWLAFRFTDPLLGSMLQRLTGRSLPGLGLLAILLLLFLAGLIATNYLGKRAIRWAENVLFKIPLIGGIYGTTRQFAEALASPERRIFRRVVLVEYPRHGLYALGFLTGENGVFEVDGQELANVFVPHVPNPTSGILIHVRPDDLRYPEMSIDEGLKLIISGGTVAPGTPGAGRKNRDE